MSVISFPLLGWCIFVLKTGYLYACCPRTHYVDQASFVDSWVGIKGPALVGPFKRAASASGENHKRGQAIQREKIWSQELKYSFLVNVYRFHRTETQLKPSCFGIYVYLHVTFTLFYLAAFSTFVWYQFYFKWILHFNSLFSMHFNWFSRHSIGSKTHRHCFRSCWTSTIPAYAFLTTQQEIIPGDHLCFGAL